MTEIDAKKRQIVREIFGQRVYQEKKEAYLSKKHEPVKRAKDSFPQTYNDISEIPVVTHPQDTHYYRQEEPINEII